MQMANYRLNERLRGTSTASSRRLKLAPRNADMKKYRIVSTLMDEIHEAAAMVEKTGQAQLMQAIRRGAIEEYAYLAELRNARMELSMKLGLQRGVAEEFVGLIRSSLAVDSSVMHLWPMGEPEKLTGIKSVEVVPQEIVLAAQKKLYGFNPEATGELKTLANSICLVGGPTLASLSPEISAKFQRAAFILLKDSGLNREKLGELRAVLSRLPHLKPLSHSIDTLSKNILRHQRPRGVRFKVRPRRKTGKHMK